jgi:hypothetical protein
MPQPRTLIIYGAYVDDLPSDIFDIYGIPAREKLKDFVDSEGYYISPESTNQAIVGFIAAELQPGDTWDTSSVEIKEAAHSWARLSAAIQAELGENVKLSPARLLVRREP